MRRAIEAAGAAGDNNSQLLSARAAVRKAELDRSKSTVIAGSRGLITDLRTEVGQFVGAGAPVMTLIALNDVWINADMTENNLGRIRPGNKVAILLDSMPGHIFSGGTQHRLWYQRIATPPAGGLPTVDNNRDWLRQAQRFPVKIAFARDDAPPPTSLRVGGQADVLVYTSGSSLLNVAGYLYIRVMSLFSALLGDLRDA